MATERINAPSFETRFPSNIMDLPPDLLLIMKEYRDKGFLVEYWTNTQDSATLLFIAPLGFYTFSKTQENGEYFAVGMRPSIGKAWSAKDSLAKVVKDFQETLSKFERDIQSAKEDSDPGEELRYFWYVETPKPDVEYWEEDSFITYDLPTWATNEYLEKLYQSLIKHPIKKARSPKEALRTQSVDSPWMNNPSILGIVDLTANFRYRERFTLYPDSMKVTYSRKPKGSYAVFDAFETLDSSEYDSLEQLERENILLSCIEKFGKLSTQEVPIMVYVLGRLLAVPDSEGFIRITATELLHFEKKTNLNQADREKRFSEYDQLFRMVSAFKPVGKVITDFGKKEAHQEPAPLFLYQGPFYKDGQNPLSGMFGRPAGFTFVDSTATKRLRNNPNSLFSFGQIRKIAQIPTGKTPLAWAQAIMLTLIELTRNNAQRRGATGDYTRETLLTRLAPTGVTLDDILKGKDPIRARRYFDEALNFLVKEGFLALASQPQTQWPRQNWADAWRKEKITIELGGGWEETPNRIRQNALNRQNAPAQNRPKRK
jgi:hypothetical protein